jgi:hypothetical protein
MASFLLYMDSKMAIGNWAILALGLVVNQNNSLF